MRSPQKGVCSSCLTVQLNHSSAVKSLHIFRRTSFLPTKPVGLRLMFSLLGQLWQVFILTEWGLFYPVEIWKGKRTGSHSNYCNEVIPPRVCMNHISTITQHMGNEIPIKFHTEKPRCVLLLTKHLSNWTNKLFVVWKLGLIERKTPSGLCCLRFFLSCVGTFLLKRLCLLWLWCREN